MRSRRQFDPYTTTTTTAAPPTTLPPRSVFQRDLTSWLIGITRRRADDSLRIELNAHYVERLVSEWSWSLETTGAASLPYLGSLFTVLREQMAYTKDDAVHNMFAFATKQLDQDELVKMYNLFTDPHKFARSLHDARSLAVQFLERDVETSSGEIGKLYEILTHNYNIILPKEDAEYWAQRVAAAGCEVDKFWSVYQTIPDDADPGIWTKDREAQQAKRKLQLALDQALRVSFDMQAYRYAVDGRPYTAAQFQDYYGIDNYMEYWMASPVAQKVYGSSVEATYRYRTFGWMYDHADVAASIGWFLRKSYTSWPEMASAWQSASWATRRRIGEDGNVHTLDEFVTAYGSAWQQKWLDAAVALCQECTAASHD